MSSEDLSVKTCGDFEHLRGDRRRGGNNHVDGRLGHFLGQTHILAGALVGQAGDHSVLSQLGSVREMPERRRMR